ncbi:hypothetical protein IMCC13023_03510 [Candidatus Aquiluna sp. IMCC13023]|uniref:class I SAM-dependent methyltransferase n=1 Tax=Candidatus Aquiluna sp. IMCC13023 TaxID=1081644 RepID=UPI00025B1E66|nr:class I SAM-dependent methyltransferase [Candidatus Aquiluna sp. IMCC13023]EIC91872.1 hypothetical protein IMCC13023_03510 [Candidatus Aquiluna sp. IMCC13023]
MASSEASFFKSPHRSIKITSYFHVYDHLLEPYVGKKITFVEIGILEGGSLFMWRDFFGKQARIIGVDLNPEAKKWEKDGFEVFIGDQNQKSFWENLGRRVGPIDVILDDGGHRYDQQIHTVEYGLDVLADEGLLVIEDTVTSYQEGFGPRKYSFINYCRSRIDSINGRSDLINRDAEKRIWSMEFFDGIVAFRKSKFRLASNSKTIENNLSTQYILDYRYSDLALAGRIDRIAYRLAFLDRVPGAKAFFKQARKIWLLSLKLRPSDLKKYF